MREQSAGTIAGTQSGRTAGIRPPLPLFRRFSETRGKAAARKNRASGKLRCGGRARCARSPEPASAAPGDGKARQHRHCLTVVRKPKR